MLDLLDRRPEALAVCQAAAALEVHGQIRHDQFGIRYSPAEYAAERLKTPFTRVENRMKD